MDTIKIHPNLTILISNQEDGNIDERFSSKDEVKKSRKKILQQIKLKTYDIIEGQQIHEDRILPLDEDNTKMWRGYNVTGVDGIINNQTDIATLLRVADCIPLVLYDPSTHVVAGFHLGWRGAVMGIHQKGVRMMEERYGVNLKDVLAFIGPNAKILTYPSTEKPEQIDQAEWQPYIKSTNNEYQVLLEDFVIDSLKSFGILKKHMTIDSRSTLTDEAFFSYTRSKNQKIPQGRNGVFIKLNPRS